MDFNLIINVVRCCGCRMSCKVNRKDAFYRCLNEQVLGRCDMILLFHSVVKHIYYLNVAQQLVQQPVRVSADINCRTRLGRGDSSLLQAGTIIQLTQREQNDVLRTALVT